MKRKPAGHILFSQISVESFGNGLILVSIADEKGLILNGSGCEERWQILDLGFSEADTLQEMFGGGDFSLQ